MEPQTPEPTEAAVPDAGLPDPAAHLPLARHRVTLRAVDDVALPHYPGSAWRGALGHALKRSVCVTKLTDCGECMLLHSCAYPYLFETPTPPDASKMRRYTSVPHPFVLDVDGQPEQLGAGETLQLGITLVGRAAALLPYIVHALERAGAEGIGRWRGRLEPIDVAAETAPLAEDWHSIWTGTGALETAGARAPTVPAPPDTVDLDFRTPTRVVRDGTIAGPDRLIPGDLLGTTLRRISMLSLFHTDTPLETDFKRLTEQARQLQWQESELRWWHWQRYSNRQKKPINMEGLIGRARLATAELGPLWPYLWLGQLTHTGKATAMGLGKYRLMTQHGT